jgi:peptide deformylase
MTSVVKFPDQILRDRMPEFNFASPLIDPEELEKLLVETMLSNKAIGLAANQIGIRARVFSMGHSGNVNSAQAFFNPMVVSVVEDFDILEEGCLSFPGIFVKVKRPKKILARWQDSKGNWQQSEFDGYNCKCFLHELDHLEGIVFQDRVSTLKWAVAVKKFKKGIKNGRTQ